MDINVLRSYAELIARSGIAVMPGQYVIIRTAPEQLEFLELLTEECYKAGAGKVIVEWRYQPLTRLAVKYENDETLGTVTNYEEEMLAMGKYPKFLKDRVSSSTGHLSNQVTARFLSENFNEHLKYIETSYLVVAALGLSVFCLFNFRPKGKAKCFAGDVGSISIAFILLFAIGRLIVLTQDVTYLILLLVYGVDGCLTICHRILLHENLGEAHRKHAYQLMANELKIGHVKVSLLYMGMQMIVSLGFIYICPDTILAHWIYLGVAIVVLGIAYILFKKKYYHLHEEYLASLNK